MQQLFALAAAGIANPKFVLVRIADGAFWSTTAAAWQAYSAGSIANYGIPATEIGATGIYGAANPAEKVPACYAFIAAAGASLATGDLPTNVRYEGSCGTVLGAMIDGKAVQDALAIIAAATAGKSETDDETETFLGLDGETVRITGTVDEAGNRTDAVYG